MAILVTGGAGYIGSHVVRQLSESGYNAIVLDNLSTGFTESLIHGETLIVADLSQAPEIDHIFETYSVDAVIHLAASSVAPESVVHPLSYYTNNTQNTLHLLKTCIKFGVQKFVFSSTAAVYGTSETGYAAEDSPTNPINPYGRSKLMCEWMLRDAAIAHNLHYVVLRYFNVAGADPQGRMGPRVTKTSHLIRACCQAALGLRQQVEIFGTDYDTPDGTGVRDYIHVEDIASAHLAAVKYLEQGGESTTLNVGYGQGCSVKEAIAQVKILSGADFSVIDSPRRPGDPAMLVAKAEKVLNTLDWKPNYANLEQIIIDSWQWEKALIASQSSSN